jgi:hypothetical protein
MQPTIPHHATALIPIPPSCAKDNKQRTSVTRCNKQRTSVTRCNKRLLLKPCAGDITCQDISNDLTPLNHPCTRVTQTVQTIADLCSGDITCRDISNSSTTAEHSCLHPILIVTVTHRPWPKTNCTKQEEHHYRAASPFKYDTMGHHCKAASPFK